MSKCIEYEYLFMWLSFLVDNMKICSYTIMRELTMEKHAISHLINEKDYELIERISRLYKVLGEKNRLGIVYALNKQSHCVHELCCMLGAEQSLISHQLKVLREADIVKTSKRGNEVVYSLADEHITKLLKLAKEHISEDEERN